MQNYLKPYITRAGILGGIVGVVVLLLSLIPVVGICFALLVWIVFGGTGVFAVMWGKGQGGPETIQQGVIDGAIAGGIAGVIAYIVKFVADLAIGVVFGLAGSSDATSAASGVVGGIVGSCIGLVFGIIGAIVLGLIGGLIYAAIQQQQKPKPVA